MKYILLFMLLATEAHAESLTMMTTDDDFVIHNPPALTSIQIKCGKGGAVLHLDTQKVEYTKGCTPTDASDKFYRYVLKAYRQDCRK